MFRNKIRRACIIALNIVKFLFLILGLGGMLFFSLGVDSPNSTGDFCIKMFFVCAGLLLISVSLEIFIVKVLLKSNEKMITVFDFIIYDDKNITPFLQTVNYYDE